LATEFAGKSSDVYVLETWQLNPDISDLAAAITSTGVLLFVDDAERISDPDLLESLKALSKMLSDQATSVQVNSKNGMFRLNGRKMSKGKLVVAMACPSSRQVASIWRVQDNRLLLIEVPGWTGEEIARLVRLGSAYAMLNMCEEVIDWISIQSEGSPGKAQRFCLEIGRIVASQAGISNGRLTGNEPQLTMCRMQTDILPELERRAWF
jgi:hypothetical protein